MTTETITRLLIKKKMIFLENNRFVLDSFVLDNFTNKETSLQFAGNRDYKETGGIIPKNCLWSLIFLRNPVYVHQWLKLFYFYGTNFYSWIEFKYFNPRKQLSWKWQEKLTQKIPPFLKFHMYCRIVDISLSLPPTKYRVTHREWDFNDDLTMFELWRSSWLLPTELYLI